MARDFKAYYLKNFDVFRWRNIKNKYGLSREDFFDLLEKQDSKCALCGRPFESLKSSLTHIDHCKETGRIRGLLCMSCNVGLGMLGDSEEGLLRALNYIRGTPGG